MGVVNSAEFSDIVGTSGKTFKFVVVIRKKK